MKLFLPLFLASLFGAIQPADAGSKTPAKVYLEEYGLRLLYGSSAVELIGIGESGEACSLSISIQGGRMSMDHVFRVQGGTYSNSLFDPLYAVNDVGSSFEEKGPVRDKPGEVQYSLLVASDIDDSRATLELIYLDDKNFRVFRLFCGPRGIVS